MSRWFICPLEEAYQIADKIANEEIHSVVINMEAETYDQGLAYELANRLDSPCLTITELKAEQLYMAVRQVRDDLQRNNV
jgi:Mg-chelatase subunit ChlD